MLFEDDILKVIRTAMPAGAEIQVIPGVGSLNVMVSWKLNDDPERPNKMSKTIAICVSHEAVQDYASASSADQADAHHRLSSFLLKNIANFDPTHNAQKDEIPPVEKWVITSDVIVG